MSFTPRVSEKRTGWTIYAIVVVALLVGVAMLGTYRVFFR
jgi:hypothetical protein